MSSSISPTPIQSVSTRELYSRWAKVYDTDGNILQAIDDSLVPDLLSRAFALVDNSSPAPITVTELGCGTGRNTVKLLTAPAVQGPNPKSSTCSASNSTLPTLTISRIYALDLTPSMLDVARARCQDILSALPPQSGNVPSSEITFHEFDVLSPESYQSAQLFHGQADLVLSTLVLEHLPVSAFFRTVKGLLKRSGVLVLTNMHAGMGRQSQAGFLDQDKEAGKVKVRGKSYAHEVQEVVDAAKEEGFVTVGDVGEREVWEEDVGEGRLLGPRGKKWIGTQVWFGCIMRLA